MNFKSLIFVFSILQLKITLSVSVETEKYNNTKQIDEIGVCSYKKVIVYKTMDALFPMRRCPELDGPCPKNRPLNEDDIERKIIKTCCEGFIYDQSQNVCLPVCDPPCQNGRCTAPDKCSCDKGYKVGAYGKCIPDCINAIIDVKRKTCVCKNGFKEGKKNKCDPQCKNCGDGKCVAPNKCDCEKGFSNNNGTCQPICNKSCNKYGRCLAPNECLCHFGNNTLNKTFFCLSPCEANCTNGLCSEDRSTCVCEKGYKNLKNNSLRCIPNCSSNCNGSGICIAPEKCSCLDGFEAINNGSECRLECSNRCDFGNCSQDGECVCLDGYRGENCSSLISIHIEVTSGISRKYPFRFIVTVSALLFFGIYFQGQSQLRVLSSF